MKQRIAFCITELDPGGAEHAFVRLVTGLDAACWEPRVYCLSGRGELADRLQEQGIPVEFLNLRHAWQIPSVLWKMRRSLREFRPAILQTWLYHANLLGRIAGKLAGVPLIHSGIRVADRRSRWRLRWDRWTARLVDRHVCVSDAVLRFSRDVGGLPEDRLVAIPNGVDCETFRAAAPADLSELGITSSAPAILYVGRLDSQKRPDLFVEVAQRLLRVRPDWHFLLAGDGPLRSGLQRGIEKSGRQDRIHLLGRRADIPRLLKASQCFVLTSDWEGMPNIVLEAMAAGVPIVSTSVEGIEELVGGRKLAVIVPPGDAEAISAGIFLVMSDRPSALAMANDAQHVVTEKFTWENFLQNFERLYAEDR